MGKNKSNKNIYFLVLYYNLRAKSSKYLVLYTGKIPFMKFFRFIKQYYYFILDLTNYDDGGLFNILNSLLYVIIQYIE